MFLKNTPKDTWNSFNSKFGAQSKDSKSSFQVRQFLAFVYNLMALVLGSSSMKGLRVTNIVK